jgi:uncharacterized protein
MRLHEEFAVAEPVSTVWRFLEQPESVARCVPGVEQVSVLDNENIQVRATQSVGPMTATFDAKVTILERDPQRRIRFRAAGRSVRGAIGNVRTDNTVQLSAFPGGTNVAVDSDLVLAGALGSVGQKVISKQASKVTAEFAANLQRALSGEAPQAAVPRAAPAGPRATVAAGVGQYGDAPDRYVSSDRWSRVAAALSGVSALLSVIVLIRQRRRDR